MLKAVPFGPDTFSRPGLDNTMTREVVVYPATTPEHEAVELRAETLEQGLALLQLDIDLRYMASPRIA